MPVENKVKALSDTGKVSFPENPYHPYDLETGVWFYHEDLVKQIKDIFDSNPEEKFITLQGKPGSGKTSTLKRIANTPGMLGSNYIPVYLDSRDYIDLDTDDLLFFIYRDVADKLSKLGYEAQEADYVKKIRRKGYTAESILLTVDLMLKSHPDKKDAVLILIFDEFDKLLENTYISVISNNIKFFENIDKSWRNYGIILAGDKKWGNLTRDETINSFLEKSFDRKLDEVVDDETVKRLIIDPVKDYIDYEEEAIKKIIGYSGKNLYFQQLICHYLFKHLEKENRDRCLITDVDRVIEEILSEPIPEFVYGWEKKISMESRLIASALADETITERKGNFFYLKEKNLLDDIFGKNLYEMIERLHDLGHFHEMGGRRFSEFPFKIPLYGEWIKVRHPFIDTVYENLEALSNQISLPILKKIILEISRIRRMSFDSAQAIRIIDAWLLLKESISLNQDKSQKADKNHIEGFITKISGLLNLKINRSPTESYFVFSINDLSIGILNEAYCFVQDRPELTREDLDHIENSASVRVEQDQTKATIFFYFQESKIIENFVKKPYLNLVAVNENDLKRIIISPKPAEAFKKVILARLSLQKVSPYQTSGPPKITFYGRSDIIDRIGSAINSSFSIVGARKIGKTSLLNKLVDDPPPKTVFIFMTLESYFLNVKNCKKFLQALEYEIENKFKKKNVFGNLPFTKNIHKLPHITRELSRQGQRIVFMFDEIDGLIDFDKKKDYELMRMFRTMSQKNLCQFIFAGFKELYHSQRDMSNPLYNFCEEIALQPLEEGPALDLITKPMESIGVRYKNEEDRELILYYTGCHPNLLQYFCKNLVVKIEKHPKTEDRRTIFREDIENLFDKEYQEYILDEVYLFKTEMSAVNRLILILLVQGNPDEEAKRFTAEEIRSQLANNGIKISQKELHIHLKHLILRFVLLDEGNDTYTFALPVFPEILRRRIDLDYKKEIIKEIKGNDIESKSL